MSDNTASNLGTGQGIFAQKVGDDLQFKSLVGGTNVTLTSDANNITFTASNDTTALNLGTGSGLFTTKSGDNLQFKSIIANADSGISLTSNSNDLTLQLVSANVDAGKLGGVAASDFLRKSDNLASVASIATARTNLSVYSKAEIDANTLKNNANQLPDTDSTYSLGSNSYKWLNIYADNFYGRASVAGSVESISNIGDIDTSGAINGSVLKYNSSSGNWEIGVDSGGGSGSSNFVGLSDTPGNFTGDAGKFVRVNAGESALEFTTDVATQTYVNTQVANLVDSAPGTLDTLNELAAALGDDANFATTVTNSIATKLATADFNTTFDNRLATKSTTNLSEGTNLYYTDARVDTHLNQSNPTAGYVLSWNGSDYAWVAQSGGGAGDITSVVAGTGLTGGATSGDATLNVDVGTTAGKIVQLDGSARLPAVDGSQLTGVSTTTTLAGLTDTTIGTPANGEVLFYNGSAWVDQALTTDNVSEGANLYYTDARADARADGRIGASDISALANVHTAAPTDGQVLKWDNGNSRWAPANDTVYTSFNSDFDTRLASKDTGDLTEGSNLYFTNARADARISAASLTDLSNVDAVVAGDDGKILYYDHSSTSFKWKVDAGGPADTDALAEGSTNLYFTNARATSAITGSNLNMGSNDITTTGKIYYANMFATEGDLPNATTYHGMFAHVHATGAGYFAHGGNWIKLANNSQLANSANWDTAYGWGDHGAAGYLTSVPAQSFASLTGKPTTIAGYGITDAFDGAFGSLSGKPTTIAGYGITDNTWANLGNKNGASGPSEIVLGKNANTGTGTGTIIIGDGAGGTTVANESIVIGKSSSGTQTYGSRAIVVGHKGGTNSYGSGAVVVGNNTGSVGNAGIVIGQTAGIGTVSNETINIGYTADEQNPGTGAIAIGHGGTGGNQESYTIAIGYQAGYSDPSPQRQDSIAIGRKAGYDGNHANTIILNATGNALTSSQASGLYIDPIRSNAGSTFLKYNSSTKEITHATLDLSGYQTIAGLNGAIDSHLNQSNPTSGYVLSWNGSDYAWIDNAGYTNTDFDNRLATKTTDNLTEGSSNLYFTQARARASISEGSTQLSYNSGTGVLTFTQGNTDTVAEGSSNLYYTSARANADFDTRLATKDTGDLAEGTNLYYTNARADARIANNILDEDNFASNSATNTASQQSIKAYVDSQVASENELSEMNDVTIASVQNNDFLKYNTSTAKWENASVTAATAAGSDTYVQFNDGGVMGGDAGIVYNKTTNDLTVSGKILYSNVYSAEGDLPSASTYHGMFAHVHGTGKGYFAHGGAWRKLLDETSSTTTDLTEGTNLYYTDARARAAISEGSAQLSYNSGTGVLTFTQDDTDGITEGSTNLYFTNARADARIGAASINALSDVDTSGASNGKILKYNGSAWVVSDDTDTDTGILNVVEDTTPQLGGTLDANGNTIDMGTNTITDTKVGYWDTAYGWGDHGAAGYLTSVPAQSFASLTGKPTTIAGYGITDAFDNTDFDTRLASKDTGDLTEGSNLYYTNARADARIAAAGLTTLSDVDAVVAGDDGKVLYYDHSSTSFKWKADATGGGTLNTAGNTGTGSVTLASETLQVLGTSGQINVDAASFALSLSLDPNINSITSIAFEGSTSDTNETKLQAVDPTADRTINLPDASGHLAVFATASPAAITDGTNGQALVTDGNGQLSFTTISGGSSLTVQDEGSSLSTAATTLNFVGAGVTASGTGATKTITIAGGGGSGGTEYEEFKINYSTSGQVASISDTSSGISSVNIDSAAGGDLTVNFTGYTTPPLTFIMYGYNYAANKYNYNSAALGNMTLRELPGGGSSGSPTAFGSFSNMQIRCSESETGASRSFGTTTHAWVRFVMGA